MTRDDARDDDRACRWCGGAHHDLMCPRVKRVEFEPVGTVRSVDFFDEGELASGFVDEWFRRAAVLQERK